jgi:single-strand DNA-binding protein
MNKAFLLGRLGRNPEKVGSSDKTIATFTLATSSGKDRTTGEDKTTWHTVKVFDKLGETCLKHLTTGRRVLVEGTINNYKYKVNSEEKFGTEVIAQRVEFLDSHETRTPTATTTTKTTTPDDLSEWF